MYVIFVDADGVLCCQLPMGQIVVIEGVDTHPQIPEPFFFAIA